MNKSLAVCIETDASANRELNRTESRTKRTKETVAVADQGGSENSVFLQALSPKLSFR